MFIAKLYIVSPSREAVTMSNLLRRAMAKRFDGDFQFQVISVLENPSEAEADRVMATPTVIRLAPDPKIRILGRLGDIDRILAKLGIKNGNSADQG